MKPVSVAFFLMVSYERSLSDEESSFGSTSASKMIFLPSFRMDEFLYELLLASIERYVSTSVSLGSASSLMVIFI